MKTKGQAEADARKIVDNWAAGALLTGWIPGSSLFLTGADMVMLRQVADTFNVNSFDEKSAFATIGAAAGSAVAGSAISEIVGFVPVVGWAIKSTMMGAKAKVLGEAIINYFRDLSPLPDMDDD